MARQLCESLEELLGSTPLVRLNNLPNDGGPSIFAKLDYYNPTGSVKDRIAFNMIRDAENGGRLKKGFTIIEATSGNTGAALALWGRRLGYKVTIVMPDANNMKLRKRLTELGAKLDFSPAEHGVRGARERVSELLSKHRNYWNPDPFTNPSNPEIHRNTTAKEIIKAMGSRKVDAFIAGVGTGGTITGVGEVLKAKYPKVKIIAVEPEESPVLSGGKPGMHFINGIGAGFVPPVLNRDIIDDVLTVSTEEAQTAANDLSLEEGICAGISSGAVMAATLKYSTKMKMKKNHNIVAFFADASWGVN